MIRVHFEGSGGNAVSLAIGLARSGATVSLAPEDAYTGTRLKDLFAQQGVILPATPPARPDLLFETGGAAAGTDGPPTASETWPAPKGRFPIHFATPLGVRGLAETTADAPPACDRLCALLGLHLLRLPKGARPLTPILANALNSAAESLALSGAIPHEVDEALVAQGWQIGPFEAQDLTGIDQVIAANPRPLPVATRMRAEGRIGKAGGVGWYRYPGGGGAVADPLIEDLLREEAHFLGHPTRDIPPAEGVETLRQTLAATLARHAADHPPRHLELVLERGLGLPKGWTDAPLPDAKRG